MGALGGYLVVLVVIFVLAPGLVASAVIAWIVALVALLALVTGSSAALYTQGEASRKRASQASDEMSLPAD